MTPSPHHQNKLQTSPLCADLKKKSSSRIINRGSQAPLLENKQVQTPDVEEGRMKLDKSNKWGTKRGSKSMLVALLMILLQSRSSSAFSLDDGGLVWGVRAASALTSYFGFVGYLDRPQGQLIENADDYLEIKPSGVEGAGLGLFAKVSLPKNTILGTYPGVVIPLQQNLDKLAKHPQCEGYIWRFSDNRMIIDPTNEEGILEPTCRGGNPSMPLSMTWHKILNFQSPTSLCRINEPPLGRDVNVVTDEDKEKRQVVFSLERDVYAGEEFFIDYGLSYDRSQYGGST